MDIKKILENLNDMEDEFYGREEDDFEGGVFEENYACAEWARENVDYLTSTIRELSKEVTRLESRLSEADYLLSDAHDLLDSIHGYDTDTYREMSKYLHGEDE